MRGWFERWQAERKRRRDIGDPAMVSLPKLDCLRKRGTDISRQVPYRTIDYW